MVDLKIIEAADPAAGELGENRAGGGASDVPGLSRRAESAGKAEAHKPLAGDGGATRVRSRAVVERARVGE